MKHERKRARRTVLRLAAGAALPFAAALLASCASTPRGGGGGGVGQLSPAQLNQPAVRARNAEIAQEHPGNYYIGRRWWTESTRFWGYIRKPGQPWSEAQLVIMNESITKQPDRVPEEGATLRHGYDHNYEYKLWGSFTGQHIYDPNSDFIVPEFRLSRYELISTNPGFLFHPGEQYNPRRLPPLHPTVR